MAWTGHSLETYEDPHTRCGGALGASPRVIVTLTSSRARSTVLAVVGIILLVVSASILASHYFGQGRAGPTLSSAAPPPGSGLVPSSAPAVTASPSLSQSSSPSPVGSPTAVPDKPGIPVKLIVARHRLKAPVTADRLNADGSLYVPSDPRLVSWGSQQVAPGSGFGTIILVAHINKSGVDGAFSDLADYRPGEIVTVVLADGRQLKYAVAAAPIEIDKDKLGPRRQELFDQTSTYGLPGRPRSARLLLLSCGGAFDNRTGHYESNIFVYALPV
jgi:hypothetical protein